MFLMVPISIEYLGNESYGIWIVISGVITWAGMFDFGLSHGLRNHLTIAIAKNQQTLGQSYVSTTYFLLLLFSIFLGLLLSIGIYYFSLQKLFNVASIGESQLKLVAFVILGFFLIRFVLKPINAVLQAHQIPAYIQVIGVIGSFVSLIAVYFLIIYDRDQSLINYAFLVSGLPALIYLVATFFIFGFNFKYLRPKISRIRFDYMSLVGGLGFNFFIIQIALLFVYSFDNYIISYLFGPTEVTTFSIPFKYYSILTIAFTIVFGPYWSAITDAYARDEFAWIKKTMNKLMMFLLIGLVLAIIMFAFSRVIFRFWIGDKVEVPITLTGMMGVYAILMGTQTLFSYFSNGIGKIRVQLIIYVFCAIVNIPLSYLFGKILGWGSTGVLFATIVCLVFVSLALTIQYLKVINKTAKGIWLR